MTEKYYLTLDNDFVEFCKLNNLEYETFARKLLNESFIKYKYPTPSSKPSTLINQKIKKDEPEDNKTKNNIYEE